VSRLRQAWPAALLLVALIGIWELYVDLHGDTFSLILPAPHQVGKALYMARPIRNDAQCARCHSTPSVAPRNLIARYGSDNGFGWQTNEIVGAQIVSVPFARATANADRVFRALMISMAAAFAVAILMMNAALYFLVVRPVRQIARVADRLSLGDMSAEEFPRGGAVEVASVTRSFNRMRKSLEKALRLLEK